MKDLIILGAGGHARSIIDIIESTSEWQICGLIGKNNEIGKKILGYKVLGNDTKLNSLRKHCNHAVIAIGQIKSCELRKKLALKLKSLGYKLPVIASQFSVVSKHSIIGEGTTIGHGAVVNANVKIGNNCIINSLSLIEHDSVIEDFCHISTGTLINGGVTIGKESFVGSNSMIRENIVIPSHTIIGASRKIMEWPSNDYA